MSLFRKPEEKSHDDALEDIRQRLASSILPEQARLAADREMGILAKTNSSAVEYSIGLTYLEYLLSLPWNRETEDNLDLDRARKVLNERHHGLNAIKERILEHLAVKKLIANRTSRILVVDDEEIARKNLDHVLSREGYAVMTAPDGISALEIMEKSEFDIVLADLRMEKMSGIDLLEKVKLKYPSTVVIMITAHASVDSAVDAMKKGAFHYITKPFKLDEVRSSVRQAAEKKAASLSGKGSVLCFAGPPGTGKTSLGKAIAEALGRKFARISLGGIKDEAEIRGHRRTYAGAMPGRIIEEIRRTGFMNPVLMLDEMDKIGQDFKGDSSSALLEVLDPEQNRSFLDHYLDVPFDLSNVLFIATANVIDAIQPPLRDRMEIIEFSGYTEDEKVVIGLRYLVPRQVREKGLTDFAPGFTAGAIAKIVHEYTNEAGIRGLERHIAAICRKIAMRLVDRNEKAAPVSVDAGDVGAYLGPRVYHSEEAGARNQVGVTTGLVRTESGGAILFVEAARMKGNKELILTGSLGNVMRESAQAALSFVRSNASAFGIADGFFDDRDIHVHVPAGAIPKDGPSAGSTIALALLSLLTGRAARRDVAITGELTLSGRILPVGGIKEKILAARRAGLKTVLLPLRNKMELDTLSEEVTQGLECRLVDDIREAVDMVLEKEKQ